MSVLRWPTGRAVAEANEETGAVMLKIARRVQPNSLCFERDIKIPLSVKGA